jgi:hypothetical protein
MHTNNTDRNKMLDPLDMNIISVWAPNVELVSYKEILICYVYNVNINTNIKLQELTSTAESYIALQKYKDYDRTKEGRHPTIREKNTKHFSCPLMGVHPENIECIIVGQAYSPSYDLLCPSPLPLSSYLSFSVFLCIAGPTAYWREGGEGGRRGGA